MNFFERRKIRKHGHNLLHHTQHVLNMREDLMAQSDLVALKAAAKTLNQAVQAGEPEPIEKAAQPVHDLLERVAPVHPQAGLRENLEVLVVAIAVAMGVRTYFLQPFKIPTGSMQPTLNGITSVTGVQPSAFDRMPMKIAKWMIWGDWYEEIRAKHSGTYAASEPSQDDPSVVFIYIGGIRYKVPRDAELSVRPGEFVHMGDLIWAGMTKAGDHVFVDRVRWNIMRPARGDVVVFATENIPTLPQGTYYIKRLIGLPGDTISIDPPKVLIDGVALTAPRGILRIENREPPYVAGYRREGLLREPGATFHLNDGQFFAMGDNTTNSRDSRYWGAVPKQNLIGPGLFVYWPLSKRWGLIH